MREQEIVSRLETKWIGREILVLDEVDSTNVRAKEEAAGGAEDGFVVLADCQTAGRGRRGRQWSSPAGENVYVTVLLRPDFEVDKAPMITLLAACAAARAVRNLELKGARMPLIKWPNDLVIGGKKICGILTEMGMKNGKVDYVVVGTGINCNQMRFPGEIEQKASSLKLEYGYEVNREAVAASFLKEFEDLYEEFLKVNSLAFVREEYEALLVNKGRKVCVLEPGKEWTGEALGITDTGELIVKNEAGEFCEVASGEVSVRGVYGYV